MGARVGASTGTDPTYESGGVVMRRRTLRIRHSVCKFGIASTPTFPPSPISMHTSVPKTRACVLAFLMTLSAAALGTLPLSGQTADTMRWSVSRGQLASAVSGMSLSLVPRIFNINERPPTCAPCDPATLPAFDRWAVSTVKSTWNHASTVVEFGLLAATWHELYRLPNGSKHLAASVEATAWNYGLTRMAKAVFNRKRPVLYTPDGVAAQASRSNQRSMYSGHTSTAFVLATSYVLSMSHKNGLERFWPLIAAAGVGAMRVAAGKHFPTDVLVGAAMGSGTAIVLHRIRF